VPPVIFTGGAGGRPIVTVIVWLVVAPVLSVTVAVKENVPGAVGVPEIAPLADPLRPGGSPEKVQV